MKSQSAADRRRRSPRSILRYSNFNAIKTFERRKKLSLTHVDSLPTNQLSFLFRNAFLETFCYLSWNKLFPEFSSLIFWEWASVAIIACRLHLLVISAVSNQENATFLERHSIIHTCSSKYKPALISKKSEYKQINKSQTIKNDFLHRQLPAPYFRYARRQLG